MYTALTSTAGGLCLLLCTFIANASAGTDWLQSQLQSNGSFQTVGDIALPVQSTNEVLRAFRIIDETASVDSSSSVLFIEAESHNNTENLALKIITRVNAGQDVSTLLTELLTHQNPDGGFAGLSGYDSGIFDTAIALEALAIAGQSSSNKAAFALNYLRQQQQADGGWRQSPNDASVYLTAVSLNSVFQYRREFNLQTSIDQARHWLLERRNASSLWGETFESALSLIAISPTLIDRSMVTGDVAVQLPVLTAGETQFCTYTLRNTGSLSLVDQEVWQVVVNITDGSEVSSDRFLLNLDPESETSLVQGLGTGELNEGDYACVLQTSINDERQSLAQGVFQVEEPDIQLDAVFDIRKQSRLLVLMDPVQETCTGTQSLTFEGLFESPIKPHGKVYAKVFDRWGNWVDEEVSTVAGFNETVDYDRDYRHFDVSITALDDRGIRVKIEAGHRSGGIFNQAFTVKVYYQHRYYGFHRSAKKLRSGLIDVACGEPLELPTRQGDLTAIDDETIEVVVANKKEKIDYGYHRHQKAVSRAESPRLIEQRALLEELLQKMNRSFTIVDDRDSFKDAFYSGEYNQYLLLAERIKLDKQLAKALREAVNRGEGLIFSGGHDSLQQDLMAILGLRNKVSRFGWYDSRYKNRKRGRQTPFDADGIELFDTELHPAAMASLQRDDRYQPVRVDVSTVAAEFTGVSQPQKFPCYYHCDKSHADNPTAIAFNDYGDGRAIYIGFDLLAEVTIAEQNAGDEIFKQLLLNSIELTTPDDINTRAGAVIPVRLVLNNIGAAVAGQAIVDLPIGSRIVDVRDGDIVADNQLRFSYQLDMEQTTQLDFWAIPQYRNGSADIAAVIQVNLAADTIDYQSLVLRINQQNIDSLDDIIGQLRAIEHEDRHLWKAWYWLQKAKYLIDKNKGGKAFYFLLKGSDELSKSNHGQTSTIRNQLGWVIWRQARIR